MRLGPLVAPVSTLGVMAPLSDVEEVEVLLRQCKHLCLGVVDAGDHPAEEDFSTAWDELMARVEHACGKLGRAANVPAVHNWLVVQEIRTILSAKHRWPQHLQAHVLVCLGCPGQGYGPERIKLCPRPDREGGGDRPYGSLAAGRAKA